MYHYFVHYSFPGGEGNTEISLKLPVRGIDDVRLLESVIRRESGQPTAVVRNYQLMREES